MNKDQKNTSVTIAGIDVYKRHFKKNDGRDLFLFGYEPHQEAPLAHDDEKIEKGGELRWHPLLGEWNIYAAHRQNRPFKPSTASDPLAPSKPGKAPTEIPFTNFELAVFENKFASLHDQAGLPAQIDRIALERANGQCEVVVYTPENTGSLATIGQSQRRLLVAAWIERYQALFKAGCKFVLPFENRGDEVGVTLPHPHGQIYGFSYVPKVQQLASHAFASGYDLGADIKTFEADYGVAEAGGMVAFCPPFARFPFETWLAPRMREPGPWTFCEDQLDGFAYLLGEISRRYDEYFQRATAYMLALHAAPTDAYDTFHFTAQFYPILRAPGRVKYLASVEQSTGVFTVDVMPEKAAKILKAL